MVVPEGKWMGFMVVEWIRNLRSRNMKNGEDLFVDMHRHMNRDSDQMFSG